MNAPPQNRGRAAQQVNAVRDKPLLQIPMPDAQRGRKSYLNSPSKMELLGMEHVIVPRLFVDLFIPISAVAGILFAVTLWYRVSTIKVRTSQRRSGEDGRTFLLEEELTGEDSVRILQPGQDHTAL